MKSFKSFAIIFGMAAVFASCSKDDDDKDNNSSNEPSVVLKAEQWKLIQATAALGTETIDLLTDDYSIIPECALDDLITFEDDGTISTDENEIICSEEEQALIQIEGNWSLNEDETIMTIDNGEQSMSGEIDVKNSKKIEFTFDYAISETSTIPGTLVLEAN